ncbi:MAG TPA: hypothetical protein VNA20_15805 [Frankiaceae bacterium]|nr:hypothetical protein [Frankiaceae bacterium]
MRTGRLPARSGELRVDAIAQLRWSMGGAGLTVDKVALMPAVLDLPVVRRVWVQAPESARAKAAYEAVVAAARELGEGVQARFLRNSLAIGYCGSGKNLTARRAEFVAAHNADVRAAGNRNYLGDTARAAYDVEHEMLAALVTLLGAPESGVAPSGAGDEAPRWENLDYDVTYRLAGRAGREGEVTHLLRALTDGVEGIEVRYFCYDDEGGPAALVVREGGTLVDDRSVGRPGFRIARIAYPEPLRAGQTHRLRYDTRYGGSPNPDNCFAVSVARPPTRLTVRVTFDRAELPARVWRMDGVDEAAGGGDPDTSMPLRLDATGHVAVSFDDPPRGFAYGVAWEWPR